ncbi:MAG TPA: V-type ATP synthase subunit F [Gemmatimonadales bacterium]|jgi:vacuolar-type H+-ATPase subunit F/Vma7|nr:V-type ATP synthase subunit F [Gemmatimonadales bacterium]
MKGAVHVVATPAVGPGFQLAGIRPAIAATPEQCARWLEALLAEPDCAMILVEDRLHDSLPEETRRALTDRAIPLVIPFPGPSGAAGAVPFEERVAELLRQAIGYRVRLR